MDETTDTIDTAEQERDYLLEGDPVVLYDRMVKSERQRDAWMNLFTTQSGRLRETQNRVATLQAMNAELTTRLHRANNMRIAANEAADAAEKIRDAVWDLVDRGW